MNRPHFTLTVAATRDGFIARHSGHASKDWVSPEEQSLFFRDVAAADWSVMGRGTHEAAPRADRRRIVFSRTKSGWEGASRFWCDPARMTPQDLPGHVEKVHVFRHGLILGGTTVHDWFDRHDAIDRVHLTVEPVEWGEGLAIFSGREGAEPLRLFQDKGFDLVTGQRVNAAGTLWYRLDRNGADTTGPHPSHKGDTR